MRMKRQGALDAIVLEQVFAFADLFENFGGKIFPVEQYAELGFVEGGILEKREQDVGGMVMNECCEVVAGGGDRLFSIGVDGTGLTQIDPFSTGFSSYPTVF